MSGRRVSDSWSQSPSSSTEELNGSRASLVDSCTSSRNSSASYHDWVEEETQFTIERLHSTRKQLEDEIKVRR